jgi:hypothetical protein
MNLPALTASAFAPRVRYLLCAAFLCVASAALAQRDYTQDLPSVERVKAEIKGSDPVDTVARHVAIFTYLQTYIQRIRDAREYNGPYTPGEQKLRGDYSLAAYQLSQDFTKTHSPAEVTAFRQKEGQYEINNALQWIRQLQGGQAADTYKGAESSLAQSYKQHEDQLQQQMKQDNGQTGSLMDAMFGGGGDLNEKQKRCLELGGAYNECAGALTDALDAMSSLLTLGAPDASSGPPPLNGVVLVGMYHSRTDLPEIELTTGEATLQKCGTLVDSSHPYTLRKSGSATQLVVDNEPDPIVLTLRGDGSLSGPGNISVKGQIVTRYHNQYACSNGNCTTSSTPIYAPKMERCALSLLAPQPAPPPPPKPKPGGFQDLLGDGDPVATIYGLRVTGEYAAPNGMQLHFGNTFATLDCGKAHINAPYTVDNTPNGFAIHVQNGGGALLLAVAPDNTLRGSGSATVNGKLVSGVNGRVVSFTPHSESCNVGAFTPRGSRNTMLASSAPLKADYHSPMAEAPPVASTPESPATPPAHASPAATTSAPVSIDASLANAGISGSPNGSHVPLRVLLSSTFSGSNPLAGQAVFVTRKPMSRILTELGVSVPANATSGQAMKALQTLCHSPQGCSPVVQGLGKYYVTTTKLDSAGKAILSATAATGPYYFFAVVPGPAGSIVWDVPANLAAGDNTVTFTETNSERLQ